MDIEKFKKESKVTYVHVRGDIHGFPVVRTYAQKDFHYKGNSLIYNGFITVPFSYDQFKSFNKSQQIAICEAELAKTGICVMVDNCDVERFYSLENDS